jgi:hypothetical protein
MIGCQQFFNRQNQRSKVMSEEQFDQVVDAILNGKYSWACFLILRFGGYNPLHYIPYRTYNRLIKSNCLSSQSQREQKTGESDFRKKQSMRKISKIEDLSYLEEAEQKEQKISAGLRLNFFLENCF